MVLADEVGSDLLHIASLLSKNDSLGKYVELIVTYLHVLVLVGKTSSPCKINDRMEVPVQDAVTAGSVLS